MSSDKIYTEKEGQYLSFIYYYTKISKLPPAEADFEKYFKVSWNAVHTMIRRLEKKGFITKTPRKSRTIKLRISRSEIPDLE